MKVKISVKKALFLTLCMIMLFSVMCIGFTVSAAECDHSNLSESNWEIRRKTTCQMSGLAVQWCYDCGEWIEKEIPLDPDAHVSGEWTTVTAHTCKQKGYEEVYCKYGCTDENNKPIVLASREIPAHDYEVIFRQEATCKSEGYEFIACLTCYDMKSISYEIDPDAHIFSDWKIVEEATCVKDSGKKERKCICADDVGNVCGYKETVTYTDSENHKNITWLDDEKLAPDCDKPGFVPGICDDCGEKLTKELPQHSESERELIGKVDSTCGTHGKEIYRCECGLIYEVETELDPDNHVYSDWYVKKEAGCTDGERYKFCLYHSDVQITQTIPANGEHHFGEWTREIEPTCSSTGLEKRVCADCEFAETRELPVKHNYGVWNEITAVSCDETKIMDGKKVATCNDCNVTTYFTVPSIHTFSEWKVVVKADCKNPTKPGTMQRVCLGCDKVETKEYYEEHQFTEWYVTGEVVCATDETSGKTGTYTRWCEKCRKIEHKAIPADHDYVEVDIVEYADCRSDKSGIRLEECKFCKDQREVKYTAEHKLGDWVTVTESSCTTDGLRKRTCILCKDYTEEEKIPAGHSYGNWYCDGGFKCESGKTAGLTRKCTRSGCDASETKEMSLDHPNKVTVVTEATCISSGCTKEVCPDCGNTTIIGEITPAKGHNLEKQWYSNNPPTCTSEGSRYKACLDCDYLEFEKIARTEHHYIEITPGVAPTCTQGGSTAETYCAICLEIFPSKPLGPNGHSIPEGSETCSVCNAYDGTDCGCACHSKSGIEKIFFNLINKLYQLIGINQQCSCGALHYDEPGALAKLFGRG